VNVVQYAHPADQGEQVLKAPFGPDSLAKIEALRGVYKLDLTAADSHLLVEAPKRRKS
jgi:hypothetical protein